MTTLPMAVAARLLVIVRGRSAEKPPKPLLFRSCEQAMTVAAGSRIRSIASHSNCHRAASLQVAIRVSRQKCNIFGLHVCNIDRASVWGNGETLGADPTCELKARGREHLRRVCR